MYLGFKNATNSGASIGLDDLVIPESKHGLIDKAKREVASVEKQFQLFTPGGRRVFACLLFS